MVRMKEVTVELVDESVEKLVGWVVRRVGS